MDTTPIRVDIFCRVIDNYGDIGVCWRLARRLCHDLGWQVRLWVDDLGAFARLCPAVNPALARQRVEHIDIVCWTADVLTNPGSHTGHGRTVQAHEGPHDGPHDGPHVIEPIASAASPTALDNTTDETVCLSPGDVVIEAFACDPPEAFIQAMQTRVALGQNAPIWLNLEYLSAERWVGDYHGLASARADGLRKFFFFPGFRPETGGLLREPTLLAQRDAFQRDPAAQAAFLQRIGLPAHDIAAWQTGQKRFASLFCYGTAPVQTWMRRLLADDPRWCVLVPDGVNINLASLPPTSWRRIPFLSQDDYDRLLWVAELNVVRGEDSWVRAIWAARPFIWQVYPQDDQAHLAKLDAWLELAALGSAPTRLLQSWNATPIEGKGGGIAHEALATPMLGASWEKWCQASHELSTRLALQTELADAISLFCAKLRQKS